MAADFEDLDPDVYCLRHGKERPMSEYGVRYGGCEDCEPGERTFDEALGAVCDAREAERRAVEIKYGR